MTNNDYKIMELLMKSDQKQTKGIMSRFLSKHYPAKSIIETEDFIYCQGDISVALVSHMDTVAEEGRHQAELYWDREKQVMFCPGYPGFDDKAGLYAIIKIVQSGLQPSVILCCDEEIGGAGAIALAKYFGDNPPELKYMIELDRANEKDCVFYQCASLDFINYVESFGFEFAYGSFSDITFLMDEWKICGVNLSTAYVDEHSYSERLFVTWLELTIDKITKMLMERDIPDFYYHESDQVTPCQCEYCGTIVDLSDLVPVKTETGYKECCIDCLTKKNIEWCESCGEPFEPNDTSTTFCNDCRSVIECTKM